MIIKKIKNDFEDERGAIRDILVKEKIDFVTIIFNKKKCCSRKSLSQRNSPVPLCSGGVNPCCFKI